MGKTFDAAIKPLIKRKIFKSEEDAVQKLLGSYVLQNVDELKNTLQSYSLKYNMDFEQFSDYLHEKSLLLNERKLSPKKRISLGKEIMTEESDLLEWKASKEILESWLGLV
jgi:hypothetical protein